ncbi:MAG TPA: alpha/beta hydrolase [Chlorobaculum sp.]|nr:alpha/beta hydrolase [Chlorobaculum sp.]
MDPIQIGNYCFKRMYLWLQYSKSSPQITEIVIELYYPNDRQAEGLVMFNHGFLIGVDLSYYPRLIFSKLMGTDSPLYEINPSWYYNYSDAAIRNNWALAFVTASHQQVDIMPWTDFVGNPRVGQEAYAAASYLVRYGATYKYDDAKQVEASLFLKRGTYGKGNYMQNRVIFAGHSVGGAHAQAAATGFENLRQLGADQGMPFDPVFYNREVFPQSTPVMSSWDPGQRANPVGLLQLSPVDGKVPFLFPGMADYRIKLASMPLPNLMVTGQCDSATLKSSTPPSWIDENDRNKSQFAQMAYSKQGSWAATCMVEKGSHCGYLRHCNDLCSQADKDSKTCDGCSDVTPYPAKQEEFVFTNELLDQFIKNGTYSGGTLEDWKSGGFVSWLNHSTPKDTAITLKKFSDGYVHFA